MLAYKIPLVLNRMMLSTSQRYAPPSTLYCYHNICQPRPQRPGDEVEHLCIVQWTSKYQEITIHGKRSVWWQEFSALYLVNF